VPVLPPLHFYVRQQEMHAYGRPGLNPFVDWVLDTIFNPTKHDGETQAEKFYTHIWG
jgi:hypothetical protein